MKNLFDYGEDKIIRNIIYNVFPNLCDAHDDAVIINVADSHYKSISLSTDPCPEPLICRFDKENKFYHYGMMSVLINYSDLAATGAKPIGILLSTIMPNDMTDDEYKQFLYGVKNACNLWGGTLLGGNIKDGNEFSVTGTSIGGHISNQPLTRKGLKCGDLICVVGDPGMFWLGIMQLLDGVYLSRLDEYTKSFLISPHPKLKEGILLSTSDLVSCCIDNSDGIIGCLYELAEINNLTIVIKDQNFKPHPLLKQFCKSHSIDYRNLMFSFGGWDLIFGCERQNLALLRSLFEKNFLSFKVIGYTSTPKENKVLLLKEDGFYSVNNFSSKRFDKHSYFSFGLQSFTEQFQINQIEKL